MLGIADPVKPSSAEALAALARQHDVHSPALIMIGTVVALHRELGAVAYRVQDAQTQAARDG